VVESPTKASNGETSDRKTKRARARLLRRDAGKTTLDINMDERHA
jgi:hypothetical protein